MKTYRIRLKGPRGGLKKPTLKHAYGVTEKDRRHYFHQKEDLKDFVDYFESSSVAGIEEVPPQPDFPYAAF